MRGILLRPCLLEFFRTHLILTALGDMFALAISVFGAVAGLGKGTRETLLPWGGGSGALAGVLIMAALAVCLLAYLPAGRLSRRRNGWPRPDAADAAIVLLLPALAFWIFLAAPMALLHNVGLQIAAILLNAPAYGCFIVLTGLLNMAGATGWVGYVGAMLAGLLPPLLFLVGSYPPIYGVDAVRGGREEYIEKQ